MSLYCRESRLVYLQKIADFMFEVTVEAMKFYEEFFGYPYAFNIYDQVFCPEFK